MKLYRSQYKRFQDLGVDNKVPGPGRYFDEKLEEENQRIQELSNKRTVGRKTQKLIGKQNEKPKIAMYYYFYFVFSLLIFSLLIYISIIDILLVLMFIDLNIVSWVD